MQLTQLEIYDAIKFADEQSIFNGLSEIYNKVPDLECDMCGKCCSDSPRITLLEYLNIYKYIRDELAGHWPVLIVQNIKSYFLNLVDTSLKCPFLGADNKCIIYQVRPFNCRTFGHKTRDEVEDHNVAFEKSILEQVKSYWKQHEVVIPDEAINLKPLFCDRAADKDRIGLKNITMLMNDLTVLERKIFSIEVIMDNENYTPFYNHLVNTILGVRANKKRPDIMREYNEQGSSSLLNEFLEKAVKYSF